MMKDLVHTKFKMLSDVDHVLLRPGRYIGSINNHTGPGWVWDDRKDKFTRLEQEHNPAFLKLFDEIISNSVDFSKTPEGKHLNQIDVVVDGNSISVSDNGGIPVVEHPDYGCYIPELIFSNLKAGSNFDDDVDSTGTGQNGEGSALTAIFSKSFRVETSDGKNSFDQTYLDNLSGRTDPVIKKCKNKGTKITYIPDCEKLNTKFEQNIDALVRRVRDVAGLNPKIKVTFNGSVVGPYKSFGEYVKKVYDPDAIFHSCKDWNVAVGLSEDGFDHVSFVNTTETRVGGSHINHVGYAISTKLRELIVKKHKVDVKPSQIMQQMRLFVDVTLVRPRYSSQTKDDLITEEREFQSKFTPNDSFIKAVFESPVVEAVIDFIMAKKRAEELAELRKKAKEKKNAKIAEHIQASAKTNRVIHFFEGMSACNHFINVRAPEHGAYPLRGKLLNVREESLGRIAKTTELMNIMAILGLQIGKPAKDMNYDYIRIATDMDYDGISIAALLMNFFSLWPELFVEGRIQILQSPLYVATKGKDTKRFYSEEEYAKVRDKLKGYQVEHMKGLGTLSAEDYDAMINNPRYIQITQDHLTDKFLDIAFGGSSQKRKNWLVNDSVA
jgi:DNA gyrase/topoisomerase IV subunit B